MELDCLNEELNTHFLCDTFFEKNRPPKTESLVDLYVSGWTWKITDQVYLMGPTQNSQSISSCLKAETDSLRNAILMLTLFI